MPVWKQSFCEIVRRGVSGTILGHREANFQERHQGTCRNGSRNKSVMVVATDFRLGSRVPSLESTARTIFRESGLRFWLTSPGRRESGGSAFAHRGQDKSAKPQHIYSGS